MISDIEKAEIIANQLAASAFGIKMKTEMPLFDTSNPNWPLAWYTAYGSLCGYLTIINGMYFEAVLMSFCEIADSIRLTDERDGVRS